MVTRESYSRYVEVPLTERNTGEATLSVPARKTSGKPLGSACCETTRRERLCSVFYEIPLLRSLGGRVQGGRVLEVGCGRGVGLSLLLREFGAEHVLGVDLDPGQVARARWRLGNRYAGRIDLSVASVEHLPFQNRSFDAVFDFGILHHVPTWQDGVAEIARVLKPGGTFYFEEVTRAALERWSYRTFLNHPKENRFSEGDFLEALSSHDLRPEPGLRRIFFGDIFLGVAKRR